MELRQLRYFVAIAEERHFGRAAQRLKIATPTLSQQLRVLERGLGVVLVERARPGPVTLTSAGEVLLAHARVLLTRADRAREEVRTAAGEPEQVLLRVASGAEVLLAPHLRRLAADPALGVVLMTSSTQDALVAVREESADAAVVWDGGGEELGLAGALLLEVDVHLALPAGHRLAASPRVRVADLREEPVVMFPRPLSAHAWDRMQGHLLPEGPSRPGQLVTESNATTGPDIVLRGVAAGKGVGPAVLPLSEPRRSEGVVLRPLDPPLTLPLELTWREPAGRALQRVVDLLVAAARRRGGPVRAGWGGRRWVPAFPTGSETRGPVRDGISCSGPRR
ncbi:LysR family transcriptional regulator [Microlunatus capsulatus]|uniref:DNA-binding transcriptional LysR family regulator n=1 Tax=Microlunatus capsulatus TaxID=99117 RepID=A0ABS4Z7G4_9ACTN|nr:LysR family transcriptional regulator [Microlunatus capsulatus]MBP2416929.1 DNA-binding transcriptional LysR family regulator [Microlunatus capsulatus]